ncbi:MAG: hypothetical protein LUI60_06505 [Clostridia bacterium]|nr:hypothetical protein [Clostridia bacterium]
MKRKIMLGFLSAVLAVCLAFGMAGCGFLDDTDTVTTSTSSTGSSSSSSSSSEDNSSNNGKNTATFEAVTIADNGYLTIIVESYEKDYLFGPAFKVYLENKTADTTIMFSITDAAVNGIMCDPLWAKEVGSGLKSYSYVYFSSLEDNGINYIKTVEMAFRAYDSDDWLADDLFEETVTLTVQNTTTESSTFSVASENGFSAVELVNSSGVLIKIIDYDEDYLLGPRFIVYIENSTDKTLMVTVDDVGVNGYDCDPYWATEVWAGKAKYSSMYWFSSTLSNYNIDAIQTVTFTLRAYDSDNWLSADIINKSVTVNV